MARRALESGEVDLVLWVNATSRESIQSSYAHAAATITGVDKSDPGRASQRFLEWAQTSPQRWLVVLDDVASPGHLRDLWPPDQPRGRVLVTTRRRDSALNGTNRSRIEVGLFTPAESEKYIASKLAYSGHSNDPSEIRALAEDLGYLPLALSQALAYMLDLDLTCREYCERLTSRRSSISSIVPESDNLPDDHHTTLAAAWSLSVEQANRLDPQWLAQPLLEISSLLDPNGAPENAFVSQSALEYARVRRIHLGGKLGEPADSPDREKSIRALHNLKRLSLIEFESAGNEPHIRVHRLIQRAVFESLDTDQLHAAAIAAADSLEEIWPALPSTSGLARVLRSNARELYDRAALNLIDPTLHDVLFTLGDSLTDCGLPEIATQLYSDLDSRLGALTDEYSNRRFILQIYLASAVRDCGQPSRSLAIYRDLLEAEERTSGSCSEDSLWLRSLIADTLRDCGDAIDSVREFNSTLRDQRRVHGSDHPKVFDTRRRLGISLELSGDHASAIAEFRSLLADELRVNGPAHPSTLHTRHHLADNLGNLGDRAGAIDAHKDLLIDELLISGADSPGVLGVLRCISGWLLDDGQTDEAIELLSDLLQDERAIKGETHPDAFECQSRLVDALGSAKLLDEAILEGEDLVEKIHEALGPQHPEALDTRGLVAYWKGRKGRVREAIDDFSRLLSDSERILGPDNLQTISTVGHLAHWLYVQGENEEALALYTRLSNDRARVHGPNDPRVFHARDALALRMLETGDSAAATAEWNSLYTDQARALGEDHPDTLHTRDHLDGYH